MFRIAVCDDEHCFLKIMDIELKRYFNAKNNEVEWYFFENSAYLIKTACGDSPFDLIFLDIEMKGPNGIETASYIQKYAPNTLIIFITSHHQYVQQAITLKVFQYLEKPLLRTSLTKELDRAFIQYRHDHFKYRLTWNGEEYLIALQDIYYFETKQRKTFLVGNKTYQHKKRLDLIETELKYFDFFRIHQSYLVNMTFISGFRKNEIRLSCLGSEIWLPVSKQRLTSAKQAYVIYRNKVSI